ncbi:MAG TPA: DUF1833 family protein [Rhodanobacteraceae bacterium]|nr:DUF1833 family protein [Rhodanobacteraceae bacterium]
MRQVSPTALQAMLAQDTAEVFVPILRIEHPDLASPILLAYNTETVTRADGDYLPYAFQVNLPAQLDEEIPTVQLTVDNTDLAVNDKIRSLVGKPTVTLSVVLASSPDTVEAGPFVMSLQTAQADANTIQGTLGYEDGVFAQLVPGQSYIPSNSPGLFT